jgi:hypothetical protein
VVKVEVIIEPGEVREGWLPASFAAYCPLVASAIVPVVSTSSLSGL